MRWRAIIPLSYVLSIAICCLAAYAKFAHIGNPVTIMGYCFLTQFLFAGLCIYEFSSSSYSLERKKSNWPAYLLIAPLISGIFYLMVVRRKILSAPLK